MSSTSPNSHNILVAEYTLGLLDLHDMAKAHQLLSSDDRAVEIALAWEDSLLELTDQLSPVDPSPLLLQRIQGSLGHDTMPSASSLYRQPSSMRNREDTDAALESATAPTPTPAPRQQPPQADETASATAPLAPAESRAPQAVAPSPASTAQVTPIGSRQPRQNAPADGQSAAGAAQTMGSAASVASIAARTREPAADEAVDAGVTQHAPGSAAAPTSQRSEARTTWPRTEPKAPQQRAEPTFGGARPLQQHTGGTPAFTATPGSVPSPQLNEARASHLAAPLPDTTSAPPPSGASAVPPSRGRTEHPQKSPSPQGVAGSAWVWRTATVVFAAIALALALIPGKPVEPPVTIVKVAPTRAAILQAPGQSSTPAWIVTFDPQGNVLMSPEVHSDIPADASVQLWTYNETLRQPRSLGLVDPNKPITIPATLIGEIGKDQYFEMTLEPQGGAANGSPSGPVLFIGRVVIFGAAQPTQSGAPATSGQPAAS